MLSAYGVGRLVKDPELNHVGDNETPVCVFNVAFNRNFKRNNEWQQSTTFMKVELWGNRAENFSERAGQGDLVLVDGQVEQDTYKDNKFFVLKASQCRLLGKLTTNSSNKDPKTTKKTKKQTSKKKVKNDDYIDENEDEDEEVPF